MKCVILQPSYLPWRGYFHQIHLADLFIFYDDVPYDHRGWRNRNRIKTAGGLSWLTIPVLTKGHQTDQTPIHQIRIDGSQRWARKHRQSIHRAYARAPYYRQYAPFLDEIYTTSPEHLVDFTIHSTKILARELGIQDTRFLRSSELGITGRKTERLVRVLTQVGADEYLSGPAAADYIEPELFRKAGITLEYMEYNYPEYEQLHPPYEPQVSCLDLLLMKGPDALRLITGEGSNG